MIVRPATFADLPDLVASAIKLGNLHYQGDEPTRAHITDVIEGIVGGTSSLTLVMEDGHGTYAGCYLGTLIANMISGKPVSVEILFWVEPEFRGHGRSLLGYVEDWARAQGCTSTVLSCPARADRAARVFEAWGYEPSERHFRKKL